MNIVVMQGNMAKDMEVSQSGDLKIARGSIALDRGKDQNGNSRGADFPSIVAFGKRAEFCEKYCKKGRRFAIEAHIQTGNYEKDGVKHYTTDFIIDRIEFADSKTTESQPAPQADGFMNIPDDALDELPFK